MTEREQELIDQLSKLQAEYNKRSLIIVRMIEQFGQGGQSVTLPPLGGPMSPRPPKIQTKTDEDGKERVWLDYGT